MSSRLPTDEALEKEDRIDKIKKKIVKHSLPVLHLLQAQQAPSLLYAKVVGRPGTGSYPAPSPDQTAHTWLGPFEQIFIPPSQGGSTWNLASTIPMVIEVKEV